MTISILLMAAVIIVPFTDATLAERRFENTMDRVSGHLLSARLESMERRLPIEVAWSNGTMQSRLFDPGVVAAESLGEAEDQQETGGPAFEIDADPELQAIEVLELPAGTTCSAIEPSTGDPEGLPPLDEPAVEPGTSFLRVAVFLPDGTVIERGPRWIMDENGRTAALWIDRRTGLPSLQRRYASEEAAGELETEVFEGPTPGPGSFEATAPLAEEREP